MAYQVIDINHFVYIGVFPIPTKQEIDKNSFNYPKYIKELITKLEALSSEERIKLLSTWAMPKEIKLYDAALGRVQTEYEQDLQSGISEDILSDIYILKK